MFVYCVYLYIICFKICNSKCNTIENRWSLSNINLYRNLKIMERCIVTFELFILNILHIHIVLKISEFSCFYFLASLAIPAANNTTPPTTAAPANAVPPTTPAVIRVSGH